MWCLQVPKEKDKFVSWSQRYIIVGYPFEKKGWKVYELDTGELLEVEM